MDPEVERLESQLRASRRELRRMRERKNRRRGWFGRLIARLNLEPDPVELQYTRDLAEQQDREPDSHRIAGTEARPSTPVTHPISPTCFSSR